MSMRVPWRQHPITVFVHRAAFEVFVRTIRRGYQIDHECCRTNCVNWHHLREVIPKTNITFMQKQKRLQWRDYAGAGAE